MNTNNKPTQTRQLTEKELELLKQCNGKHKSVQEIITCKSCTLLLDVLE